MKTVLLASTIDSSLDTAVAIIQDGGIVAIPTDTVYGIGCSAFDEDAVLRLYEVKERSSELAIPVLISQYDQFENVARIIPSTASRLANVYWPGPLTLVVHKSPGLAEGISSADTVGVRMPDDAFALLLISKVGPMAVTSANITGSPSLCTAREVLEVMDGKIELVVDGGTTQGGIPSTVVDCTGITPIVLRHGPISQSDIDSLVGT